MYFRLLMLSVFFSCLSCSNFEPWPTVPVIQAEVMPSEPAMFRTGVAVYPAPSTTINSTLLTEREGYATIFTDPYGYLWTMSTALGLTDQDFAKAAVFQADETESGATFYYGKVNTWEMQADCVVYVAASQPDYVSLRRNQDQGPCPTSAGYAAWLPYAESTSSQALALTRGENLGWAYGANNHEDNIIHGVFEDVEAYGNDPYGWFCNDFRELSDCLAYAGIRLTGAKWDSAEFVSRYFITKFDHAPMWQGPAKYWFKEAKLYGFMRFPNCGSVRPEEGDMLVSEGGSHGHAAIIRAVSDHSVTVIQQNWFESEADNAHTLSLTTSGNRFCVSDFGSGYPVVGWVRE